MCLGVFFLGFILYGTLCTSWTWLTISFPILGNFSTIISSNILSIPFFFSSSYTPIIRMLVHLMLSQRSLRLSSVLFILFSLFYSAVVMPTILSSRSFFHSSASVILLLIPSREFLIYLLCWSSLFVCSYFFYFQDFRSSLLSLLWILFRVDCLFPFHLFGLLGFYLAPSSAAYFSRRNQ